MEIFHNTIGIAGSLLIVFAYLALQTGKLGSDQLSYSVMNLIGAGAVIFSLVFEFNLASFLVESFWVIVSLIGIYRCIVQPKTEP